MIIACAQLQCDIYIFNMVYAELCVCVCQVWGLDGSYLEPEWEQYEQLHTAGAETLHTRGGAGRPQQQRRHLARLECKHADTHHVTCGSPCGGAVAIMAEVFFVVVRFHVVMLLQSHNVCLFTYLFILMLNIWTLRRYKDRKCCLHVHSCTHQKGKLHPKPPPIGTRKAPCTLLMMSSNSGRSSERNFPLVQPVDCKPEPRAETNASWKAQTSPYILSAWTQ